VTAHFLISSAQCTSHKQNSHQRPATAGAIRAVLQPHHKRTPVAVAPVTQEKTHRGAAVSQTDVLEGGELIYAGRQGELSLLFWQKGFRRSWTEELFLLQSCQEANDASDFRPAGVTLEITGRRLDAQALPLEAHVPCCYPTRFQATGLIFPIEGCWEVTAKAADSELSFVVKVEP
jgi:hypothetical protein